MTNYRGHQIEHFNGFDRPYLIHLGGMYAYYWFKTVEAARSWIDERLAATYR